MISQKTKFIIFLIIALSPLCSFAQQKFEKEYRIKESEVPQSALSFMKGVEANNIKWLKEESQDGKSIEAKFKFNGANYSVEFDRMGNIEDVEIDMKKGSIPDDVFKQIDDELQHIFSKHKFKKIQLQYNGGEKALLDVFQKNDSIGDHSLEIRYEVVLTGKQMKKTELYEVTFDDKGKLIKKLMIDQKNYDHLEY